MIRVGVVTNMGIEYSFTAFMSSFESLDTLCEYAERAYRVWCDDRMFVPLEVIEIRLDDLV